jgi:lysozyme
MNVEKALSYAVTLVNGAEGYRSVAYLDVLAKPAVWTIGYGTTRIAGKPVRQGMTCSAVAAHVWAMRDMQSACDHVLGAVKVAMTDGQLAAMISFTYNLGPGGFDRSSVLEALNRGFYAVAANRLLEYDEAGGVVYRGLETRRGRERNLFLLSGPGFTVTPPQGPSEPVQPVAPEMTTADLNDAELSYLNSQNPKGLLS